MPPAITSSRSIWRMIPRRLAYRYIPRRYHDEMRALFKAGADHHSMEYRPDYTLKRIWRIWKNHIGCWVRFNKYCVKPKEN